MAAILNFSNSTPVAPSGEALGTWQVDAATPRNTSVVLTPMVGATASPSTAGVGGAVPQPLGADAASGKFLRADGTWAIASGTGGTVTSIAVTAPAFLSVTGSPVTASGTIALALATQSANTVFAGPSSGGAVAPTFRAMAQADLPVMTGDSGSGGIKGAVPAPGAGDAAAGKFLKADGTFTVPPGTGGSVSSVALAAPVEFTVSGSPVTTSGTLTFAKSNQTANLIYSGPSSGGATAPTFRALVAADLPGAILAKYTSSWTSQTSLVVTHGLGSANIIVAVYDGSGNVVTPQNILVSSTQITLTFGSSFTGSLVAIG